MPRVLSKCLRIGLKYQVPKERQRRVMQLEVIREQDEVSMLAGLAAMF
jgi:hypothetical protein